MTKKTWRSLLLMVGVMLLAAGAVLFWPSPESGVPGPSTDEVQVERESAAGPEAVTSAGVPESESASEPSPSSSPESDSSPSVVSRSARESSSTSARPRAEASERWAQRRSRDVQDDEEASPQGEGAEPEQLRRAGALARVDALRAAGAADAQILDEIGPAAYDQLLYEQGRDNRSKVQFVAERSNAGQAGIQRGDVILSYGGEPVFAPRSLRESNRLFAPGGEIVVQVDRGGQILELTVETDPIDRGRSAVVNGMVLAPVSQDPNARSTSE